jgi:hypothetical protein
MDAAGGQQCGWLTVGEQGYLVEKLGILLDSLFYAWPGVPLKSYFAHGAC